MADPPGPSKRPQTWFMAVLQDRSHCDSIDELIEDAAIAKELYDDIMFTFSNKKPKRDAGKIIKLNHESSFPFPFLFCWELNSIPIPGVFCKFHFYFHFPNSSPFHMLLFTQNCGTKSSRRPKNRRVWPAVLRVWPPVLHQLQLVARDLSLDSYSITQTGHDKAAATKIDPLIWWESNSMLAAEDSDEDLVINHKCIQLWNELE